jgi:lipopolysaccharide/colanic/teichoic acid biosynthesis glycosyltransferase
VTTIYDAAKRTTDVVVSAAGLVVIAPLTAAIAWRVHREDGGPVIFKALRVGRYGRTFHMLKFRSMVLGADQLGLYVTPNDDPSLTGTGRFLRRWKLDELPQLVNVLRGEMSLVGPRPPTVWDADHYDEQQKQLLEVRPGITDWASIRYRSQDTLIEGQADPHVAYFEMVRPGKMELALAYVHHRGYLVDLGILGLTALALLRYRRTDELLQRMVTSVRARV